MPLPQLLAPFEHVLCLLFGSKQDKTTTRTPARTGTSQSLRRRRNGHTAAPAAAAAAPGGIGAAGTAVGAAAAAPFQHGFASSLAANRFKTTTTYHASTNGKFSIFTT